MPQLPPTDPTAVPRGTSKGSAMGSNTSGEPADYALIPEYALMRHAGPGDGNLGFRHRRPGRPLTRARVRTGDPRIHAATCPTTTASQGGFSPRDDYNGSRGVWEPSQDHWITSRDTHGGRDAGTAMAAEDDRDADDEVGEGLELTIDRGETLAGFEDVYWPDI